MREGAGGKNGQEQHSGYSQRGGTKRRRQTQEACPREAEQKPAEIPQLAGLGYGISQHTFRHHANEIQPAVEQPERQAEDIRGHGSRGRVVPTSHPAAEKATKTMI